jgi:uncharacterized cupin superfamily protein
MPNFYAPRLEDADEWRVARLGSAAGAEHLGMSLYELAPGQGMVFHYHVQREELLIVARGTVALRTAEGWRDLAEGDVVSFPRGPRGAHGFENRSKDTARVLMISEQNAPNISVYPDRGEIGVFDEARRERRRLGALFRIGDARSGYGGGKAEIIPPEPGPRQP